MPSHLTPLHAQAADAVATRAGVPAADLKVDATPKPELGDLAVGCFAIAKARGQNPAEVAKDLAAAFQPTELLASAEAAGPFVNFRANKPAVVRWLVDAALAGRLLPRTYGEGQTIVIDYSSPNVSKQLAYHHIRSTMIGHALAQIFRALGHPVVGINHLGDWGTTHGKLIAAWKMWGPIEPLDIAKLNELYVKFGEAAKADPSLEDQGRAWFKKLEDGDPEARALWKRFYDISMAEYQTVYDLLGVKFDLVKGESEYLPDVPRVLETLAKKGLSSESEGALVVAFADEKTPLILKKSDDATTYATRDIPSAEFRWNTWHFARSLYVVDRGQSLHFKQLFKTLALMGHEWASRCEHVPFGLVQIGGKKGGTRSGNVILLKDVVGEAESRVRALLAEINPELPADVVAKVAPMVGIGAVVFANLASQRDKDVAFEWDRVITLHGDSGAYVQYSHARCASIMRKAGADPAIDEHARVIHRRLDALVKGLHSAKHGAATEGIEFSAIGDPAKLDPSLPEDDRRAYAAAEWAVARRLLEYPSAVVAATPRCEPHVICHYLLELAGDFSRWYTFGNAHASLRVLCDDPAVRAARLALVAAVQAVLREGLYLLGLGAPDQM